jgi:hypothetical protein
MVQCNYHQKYLPTPGVAKLGIEDLLLKCSCLSILLACLSKIEEKKTGGRLIEFHLIKIVFYHLIEIMLIT